MGRTGPRNTPSRLEVFQTLLLVFEARSRIAESRETEFRETTPRVSAPREAEPREVF